jgi:HAD superfamily hydrolase (TIGR01490 family)
MFYVAQGLRQRGLLRVRDITALTTRHLRYRLSGTERNRDMEQARSLALEFIRGRSSADLRAVARDIVRERVLPALRPMTLQQLRLHQVAGDQTFIVTAAAREVADALAEHLGMGGTLATTAEVDGSGRYTGRLAGPVLHGAHKAAAVSTFARERGLDLAQSAAYSDSIHDLPLLELVGRPCAVNPHRRLRAEALRRGWPVLDR